MLATVNGIPVHYRQQGSGPPPGPWATSPPPRPSTATRPSWSCWSGWSRRSSAPRGSWWLATPTAAATWLGRSPPAAPAGFPGWPWCARSAARDANPTLILAGRQDATVGDAGSWRLLEHDRRASVAVLDRAGHALPHEQAGRVCSRQVAGCQHRPGPPGHRPDRAEPAQESAGIKVDAHRQRISAHRRRRGHAQAARQVPRPIRRRRSRGSSSSRRCAVPALQPTPDPLRTLTRTRGLARMFSTQSARHPRWATSQKVSPSRPSHTGVRRGCPVRRPVVSSRASPGGGMPSSHASMRIGLITRFCSR
jgi:hypothetical protein